ncbi:MAG: DNA polymerase I [Myxococcales bacterium FL481]|nr:MAG: DNA polymerase I [Myxococcales bacterium FL481]
MVSDGARGSNPGRIGPDGPCGCTRRPRATRRVSRYRGGCWPGAVGVEGRRPSSRCPLRASARRPSRRWYTPRVVAAERIIIIDGSAVLYRAYFAIPGQLSTAAGLHTNAIFGFASSFRKLLAGRTPEYGVVVFDAPGPTFREEKYPAYKAHRPSMPDELREQLEWIDRVVEANAFPLLRVPGYEADDVIGTISRWAVEGGIEVRIVSGDKDFAQLISDEHNVRMLDTLRDITYDVELVRKKWGVLPHQFVDWLAMVGDKSDNIPGVPGIGAKGAAKLLADYGDLDGVLANAEGLRGRQRSAMLEFADQARLSRDLATIETSVPLEVSLEDLRLVLPEPSRLNELYKELEFYSLLAEQDRDDGLETSSGDYVIVREADQIAQIGRDASGCIAVFGVFDGASPVSSAWVGLGIAVEPGRAWCVPLCEADETVWQAVGELLGDPTRKKVTYNAKSLWIAARRRGLTLAGVEGDVMLESFLVDPTKIIPHELDAITKEYLQRTLPKVSRVLGSGQSARRFSELDHRELATYVGLLVDCVGQAHAKIRPLVEQRGHLEYLQDVELPLSWILGQMELDGIAVDREDLAALGAEFSGRLKEFEHKIYACAGREFNIGSPKQLGAVLFDELELPVIKRTKTGYSTNAEVLERLAPHHEIASLLLEHRKLAKLINTYTDVLQREINPDTGRIHATFQLTVGATGRLISTEPDLQRTPIKTPEGRRIRQAFVAKPGHQLISADWSQIELRLLAHVSGDERLVAAFRHDDDVHAGTASQLFGCAPQDVTREQRAVGKLVNFSTIYGQGATALARIVNVTRKEAQRYIDGYFAAYRGVRHWLDATIAAAHEDGYVTTLLGRRRYIPELSSNAGTERQAGERIAANTPIQGSAADICKLAMVAVAHEIRDRRLGTRMLLQIHDELVFEAPMAEVEEVMQLVRHHMETVVDLDVPLVTDVGAGRSWADAH